MRYLLALSLFLAQPAYAGPKNWIKHQLKDHPTRSAFVFGAVAGTVNGLGLAHCRQGSVENCQAKYGAAWGSFAAVTSLNFAVIGASHGCRKDDAGHVCDVLAFGGSAIQLGFGVNQFRKQAGKPEEKTTTASGF